LDMYLAKRAPASRLPCKRVLPRNSWLSPAPG